jgi:hypothetical protein
MALRQRAEARSGARNEPLAFLAFLAAKSLEHAVLFARSVLIASSR